MSKNFVEKAVRKVIAQNMSKTQRKALAEGETFIVHIHRFGRELKRWGWDNNNCHFHISGKNMNVHYNSLSDMAWDNRIDLANDAISYFIYGGKGEYKMVICAIDHPTSADCEAEAAFRYAYEN